MSLRTILVVVLALVLGVSAAWGIKTLGVTPLPMAAPKAETVTVVVTAAEVARGTSIAPDMVTTREWPRELVPEGAIRKVEDALDRVAYGQLVKGECLLEAKLAPKGVEGGLAPLVREGMRGFNVQMPNFASSVAGFIMPGNHVDVMLTMNAPPRGLVTKTLLENVEVLAVHQRLQAPREHKIGENEAQSVTLQVTPEQAERLELAQNRGTLKLALRNPRDSRPTDHIMVTEAELSLPPDPPDPPRKAWEERLKQVEEAISKVMTQVSQMAAKIKEAAPPPPPVVVAPEPRRPTMPFVMTIINGDKVTRQEYPDYPVESIVQRDDPEKLMPPKAGDQRKR